MKKAAGKQRIEFPEEWALAQKIARDLLADGLYAGNPAKLIKMLNN